jgi:hypothetical protein
MLFLRIVCTVFSSTLLGLVIWCLYFPPLNRGPGIGINKRQGKFSPPRFLVCGCANLLACPVLSWWLLWMDENYLQFGLFFLGTSLFNIFI